jgi:hypothetical protein
MLNVLILSLFIMSVILLRVVMLLLGRVMSKITISSYFKNIFNFVSNYFQALLFYVPRKIWKSFEGGLMETFGKTFKKCHILYAMLHQENRPTTVFRHNKSVRFLLQQKLKNSDQYNRTF